MQHPPLRDLPLPPFEAQSKEFRNIINDTSSSGGQRDERARQIDEAARRINVDTLRENQSYYILNQWGYASELLNPRNIQKIRTEMVS